MLRFWKQLWKRDVGKPRAARHAGAVAVLLLLPLLAVVGSLAPVVVTVQYEEEAVFPPPKPEPFRAVHLARRALSVAKDYTTRWIPEMLDLERLFARPRNRIRVARLPAEQPHMPEFPRARGDMIVLSDMDNHHPGALFKEGLQPGVVADATAVWDPRLFNVIADTTRPSDTAQFDDFTGQGESEDPPPPIVPEPGTGSLLTLGLIALALRRRRSAAS
jgi:hypothetical protein